MRYAGEWAFRPSPGMKPSPRPNNRIALTFVLMGRCLDGLATVASLVA